MTSWAREGLRGGDDDDDAEKDAPRPAEIRRVTRAGLRTCPRATNVTHTNVARREYIACAIEKYYAERERSLTTRASLLSRKSRLDQYSGRSAPPSAERSARTDARFFEGGKKKDPCRFLSFIKCRDDVSFAVAGKYLDRGNVIQSIVLIKFQVPEKLDMRKRCN